MSRAKPRLMPSQDRAVIAAVITALHVPRTRYGKLDGDHSADNDLTAHALRLGIPHGGLDSIDKACMVLQALIGRKPRSILDDRNANDGRR